MTESGSPEKAQVRKSNRPGGTKFKQQKLPAWEPVLSATTVLPALLAIGLAFIPLGIAFLVVTNAVKEEIKDYTNCKSSTDSNRTCSEIIGKNISETCTCLIDFDLKADFPSPVFMYYGMKSFYQNHRRYVRSRDDAQLLGGPFKGPTPECAPYIVDKLGKVYAPCGVVANSMFNDTFRLTYRGDNHSDAVEILKTGIAWPTDVQTKFQNPEGFFNSTVIGSAFNNSVKPPYWSKAVYELDPTNPSNNGYKNEDLMVWMRTAAFPNFRKLYGRINHSGGLFINGLKAGRYQILVNYNYPVSKFNGAKTVILTTLSFLGGKNSFLGIAYLVVGSLSLIIALAFLIIHLRVGRKTQRSLKTTLNKFTPYFDTTMSDLTQSKMNAFY